MKYRIRFNKSRGQPGRGTKDHVWRIFDETGKEWITKNVRIEAPSFGEKEPNSEDWNIVTNGNLHLERGSSTAVIS